MPRKYAEIAYTESVKQTQAHYGSRTASGRRAAMDAEDTNLTTHEAEFIAERDSFYMATVNADGWPYVQFRGGPTGFLKVLDGKTLAYTDFSGNRQYISTGNLKENDRVSLFFMDYANRRRLKLMARTEVFEAADRPDLVEGLVDSDYGAAIERVVVFHVEAYDWNCPQHITPRFTALEWNEAQDANRSN